MSQLPSGVDITELVTFVILGFNRMEPNEADVNRRAVGSADLSPPLEGGRRRLDSGEFQWLESKVDHGSHPKLMCIAFACRPSFGQCQLAN